MFCVFREFCGSKYLCKSVKSVGEYSLSVCSVFREFCGSIILAAWVWQGCHTLLCGRQVLTLKLFQQERRLYAQIDASRKTHLIIIVIHLVANDEVVRGQRVEHISLHAP